MSATSRQKVQFRAARLPSSRDAKQLPNQQRTNTGRAWVVGVVERRRNGSEMKAHHSMTPILTEVQVALPQLPSIFTGARWICRAFFCRNRNTGGTTFTTNAHECTRMHTNAHECTRIDLPRQTQENTDMAVMVK